jgi:hypothetical protein
MEKLKFFGQHFKEGTGMELFINLTPHEGRLFWSRESDK